MNIKQYIPKKRTQLYCVIALVIITIINIVVLQQELRRIKSFKQVMPHQIIGYQFAGLEEVLQGVQYVGYYTDKDIENDKETAKLFSHAQYILAPTVLDFNNTTHEYIIFVCSSEQIARIKIQQLKMFPIRRNKYGMILAKKL